VRESLAAEAARKEAMPLGHLASRAGGCPEPPPPEQGEEAMERWHAIKRLLAMGVSNLHIDLADSRRARGVPIVYYPRISEAARRRGGFRPDHPLPSSDIVIAENACRRR
jgi:hypothetical protein